MSDITLTASAVGFLQKTLSDKTGVLGIRLGVKPAGCSGSSYIIDFAKEIRAEDKIFEAEGVKIVVDPTSFEVLQGMEIDCMREGLNETLRFNNPNVKSACGCGESFSVEK